MKSEAELRELHTRLVKALGFAAAQGMPRGMLAELVHIKVTLEWIIGMDTKSADIWQAALFRGLNNLEGLKRTHERLREAASN